MISVDDHARLIQLRQAQQGAQPKGLTNQELQEVLDITRRSRTPIPEWQIDVFRNRGLDVTGLEAA